MQKAIRETYSSHNVIQNTHRTTTTISSSQHQTKNRYPPECTRKFARHSHYDIPDDAKSGLEKFNDFQTASSPETQGSGGFSLESDCVYANVAESKNVTKKSNYKSIPCMKHVNICLHFTSLLIGIAALGLCLQDRFQTADLKQGLLKNLSKQIAINSKVIHNKRLLKQQIEQIAINSKKIQDNYHSILTYHSKDCKDVLENNFTTSGVYFIFINHEPVQVYCDMETDGGGWTIFQKRFDGSEQFNRSFAEYEEGFGDRNGEYWLGLQHIYTLTNSRSYTLRVDLEDFSNNTAYAEYSTFVVGNSDSLYKFKASGYTGNAGDSLRRQNRRIFKIASCRSAASGWWDHRRCPATNLNGKHFNEGECNRSSGIIWRYWNRQGCLKRTEMKLRPN